MVSKQIFLAYSNEASIFEPPISEMPPNVLLLLAQTILISICQMLIFPLYPLVVLKLSLLEYIFLI